MAYLTQLVAAQFIGGTMFFVGLALVCLAMITRFHVNKAFVRSGITILATIGAVFVVFSASPFPLWAYIGWFILLGAGWAISSAKTKLKYVSLVFLVCASATMATTEGVYYLPPRIDLAGCETLFVIGDSLSMGANPPGENWPVLLGEKLGVPVENFSFGGATLESALHNAARIDKDNALVILEIGGNDLLSGRRDFVPNLERMLATVCKSQRRVVMMELPLPPFFNSYGIAQRRLARAHGIALIPKRYLAATLAAPGATVDGLHLSNKGHELLAQKLHALFIANK